MEGTPKGDRGPPWAVAPLEREREISAATFNNSPSKTKHGAQKPKATRTKPKSPKAKTTTKRRAQ